MALAGFRWLKAALSIGTESEAGMAYARSADVDAAVEVTTEKDAGMQSIPSENVVVQLSARTGSEGGLSGHTSADVGAKRTISVTVGQGLRGYIVAPLDAVKAMVMDLVSTALAAPGRISKSTRTMSANVTADGMGAPGKDVFSEQEIVTAAEVVLDDADGTAVLSTDMVVVDLVSVVGSATGTDLDADSAVNTERAATMAFWIEPTLVNGVLRIRQAYSAEQKDIKLEVR